MNSPRSASRLRRHAARWVLRGLGLLVCGAVAGGVAALLIAHNLERAWLKLRIQALVLANQGLEIEYRAARAGLWSGIDVDDLVVRSPGTLRGLAPELARVGHLHASWSAAALLGGARSLRSLELDHLSLTLVVDENGRSSFAAIPQVGPAKAPTPWSRFSAELLASGLPVAHLRLRDATIVLLRTERGAVTERDTLRGLALEIDRGTAPAGARLDATLGRQRAPLDLQFEREGGERQKASLKVWLALGTTAKEAELALDVRITEQDWAPAYAIGALAHVNAKLQFDPAHAQTKVAIAESQLGEGVATVTGRFVLPDAGFGSVQHLQGQIDVLRLLALLPAGSAPFAVSQGRLSYEIDDFSVHQGALSARLVMDGELQQLSVRGEAGEVSLGRARLTLRAEQDAAGVHLEGDASCGALEVSRDGINASAEAAELRLALLQSPERVLNGGAELSLPSFDLNGATALAARGLKLALTAKNLKWNEAAPVQVIGELELQGRAKELVVGDPELRANLVEPRLRARVPLAGKPPFALDAELSAARLRLGRDAGHTVADAPLRLELALKELSPNWQRAPASSASGRVTASLGAIDTELTGDKRGDVLDYDWRVHASALAALRPLLPEKLAARVPLEKMTLELHSQGRAERLSSSNPHLRQQAELKLMGAAYERLSARTLALQLKSDGDGSRHLAEAALNVEALTLDGINHGNDQLALDLALDRSEPSIAFEIRNEGLSSSTLKARFTFDRSARTLGYEVTGKWARLASAASFLPKNSLFAALDLSELELGLRTHGTLSGLVTAVDSRGMVELSPDVLHTIGGRASVELSASHLDWESGERALTVPSVSWRAELQGEGIHKSIASELLADSFVLGSERYHFAGSGFHHQALARLNGDFVSGSSELSQHLKLAALEQNVLPLYPVGDVDANVVARRDSNGLIKIAELNLANGAAGTRVALQGGLELNQDQRRLSLRAKLQQQLARLSTRRDLVSGDGNVALDFALESPDLRLLHAHATLTLDGVALNVPSLGIELSGVDGELPIVTDLRIGRKGVELVHDVRLNPYAMLRFADQHPLLSHRSFLSIARVRTPFVDIAPFAANFKVEQNIISLSQVEMGVRGGSITGNSVVEWDGEDSKVHAEVRASNVQSSHGEPFDGNAALLIDIGDRSIEGRADILRIGRRHLYDLLDLEDPHRADPAMNRIRSALELGYPDRVRISFRHGFASAGVSFGGLASLARVDDVRGIPVGPLMERAVRSFKPEDDEEEKEQP